MPKRLDFKLSENELWQITQIISDHAHPDVRHRAVAIQSLAAGEKLIEVARRMKIQPATVRSWFWRFRQYGHEGLTNLPRGRPKRKADQAYCQALDEAIVDGPGKYGYQFHFWTVERLLDHLEERTGTSISSSRLRMLIRNRGHTLRHMKFLSKLQDS
jgi:transposase